MKSHLVRILAEVIFWAGIIVVVALFISALAIVAICTPVEGVETIVIVILVTAWVWAFNKRKPNAKDQAAASE